MDALAAAPERSSAGGPASADLAAGRLMAAAVGTVDILVIAPGERLGYYRLLAAGVQLTAPALAAASGTALVVLCAGHAEYEV
jgi:hypothetical protein